MKRLFIAVLVCITLTLNACGSTEVVQPVVNVSIGQQLIDLKKAYEGGAMSKDEYETQREKLIDSVQH